MEEKTNRRPGRAAGTAEQRRVVQELAQSGEAQKLLSMLPREELDRVDQVMLDHYYKPQVNAAHRDLGSILKK